MGVGVAEAEDLTQEVFLRVVKAIPAYQERNLERAWVFRIARNVRLDEWRARDRAPVPGPLPDGESAGGSANHAERLAIEEALGQLGQAEREAFVLREVGGLGYAEIADAAGATPDAVRSRIHRARLALRQALAGGPRADRAAGGREG
jgi:RNA polymerase sigma-70 factor (ECF subfamily)